ncbi:MAG: hypothetical protein ACI8UG_002500 [Gammaproteobacteria bacterium]|jgi:hypothetical protein
MKQYLAIVKRDYGATDTETLWLPAPIFWVLFAVLFSWLNTSGETGIRAWHFLAVSVLGAYRILDDLSLSRGHSLGFFAPSFHTYQFNYSTSLVFISSVITCAIFGDSFYEFFVCLSVFWLVISFMFFFVKKAMWKFIGIIGLATNLLAVILMIFLEQTENIFTIWSKIYSSVWSLLSMPAIGVSISSVCLAVSYKSFLLARSHYLKPEEYDPDLAPRTWKKHRKTTNFNVLQLITNSKRSSKTWNKVESRILFGLDLGRHQDLLYLGLFGARVYSYLLKFILGTLLLLFVIPLSFVKEVNQEAILIPICIFMLFYLIVLCTVISLEWITNRKSIADLWLLDASKNRASYMLKVALLFAERIGRISLFSCTAFLLLATIISGVKGLLVVGMVAITSVVLSLLLQMAYVLLVSITVKHTGWLRYITVLFTGINFVGWLAVVFFSVQQKQYWILVLAIGLAFTLCLGSIKYWCRYDKELAE